MAHSELCATHFDRELSTSPKGEVSRVLLRLLPKILRARDFHLYLDNGKRLTDLWLSGGRAVLGHKPPGVLRELKNAAERGLFTPLPHPAEKRFLKALTEFFPDRSFRLYTEKGSLYRALDNAGITGPVPLWRPFQTSPSTPNSQLPTQLFIPVLPWPLGPEVLVLAKDIEASFPPGDLVPPVLLAPATRALYDLAAAMKAKKPNRAGQIFPKIEKALTRQAPDTSYAGGVLWRRQGIYLTVEEGIEKEKYSVLFRRFLDGGFLLPPEPKEPAILPASMSDGEEAKLAELIITRVVR